MSEPLSERFQQASKGRKEEENTEVKGKMIGEEEGLIGVLGDCGRNSDEQLGTAAGRCEMLVEEKEVFD